jgi:hypothetical protein
MPVGRSCWARADLQTQQQQPCCWTDLLDGRADGCVIGGTRREDGGESLRRSAAQVAVVVVRAMKKTVLRRRREWQCLVMRHEPVAPSALSVCLACG